MSDAQAAGPIIHGVPLALWVAIGVGLIAPLVSFISTLIANHHDSKERDRDRTMTLRREVYLECASAIVRLQSILANAANLDQSMGSLTKKFSDAQRSIVKAHVVASDATVEALMTYMNELSPAYIETLTRRAPMMIRNSLISVNTELMNKAAADRDRFIEMMRQLNIEPNRDAAKFAAVNAQYRFASEQFDSFSKVIGGLRTEQISAQVALSNFAVTEGIRIAKLIPAALLAVRGELELPIDAEKYLQLWAVQNERAQRSYQNAVASLAPYTGKKESTDTNPSDS